MVFVPSAPALVPELAGPGAVDVEPVRAASIDVLRAATEVGGGLPLRWFVLGDNVGAQSDSRLDGPGTCRGFGVDRVVSLDVAAGSGEPDAGWPTSMLLAGWLREMASIDRLIPIVVDADGATDRSAGSDPTVDAAASLRARLLETSDPVGLLVVGDGATSLSARAPGGGDSPQARALQERIDAALGNADTAALTALTPAECALWGVGGRAVWQVAAAALDGVELTGRLDYAGAPLGVGYTVASWTASR